MITDSVTDLLSFVSNIRKDTKLIIDRYIYSADSTDSTEEQLDIVIKG